jgi:putative polyhydroxyalkanoate system protein
MADIEIRRAHTLGLEDARAATERMQGQLARKFGLAASWEGDTLHFERPGVSGSLALTGQTLYLTIALGFMLKAMKGPVEKAVTHELDMLFGGPAGA